MKTKSGTWKILILGIFSVMLGYLDWCLLTIAYKNSMIYGLALVGTLLLWLLYCKFYFDIAAYEKEYVQFCCLNKIWGLCNFIIFLFSFIRKADDFNGWIAFIHLGWVIICLTLFLCCDKHRVIGIDESEKTKTSKTTIAGMLGFGVIIIFLALDRDMLQFKWDGLLYYRTCRELSLYSISNLAIYGHIAQTYGALVRVAVLVFGDTAIAMIVMNIVILLCGTVAFYKTLKLIMPKQNELMCLLGTMLFVFSPFCLGMVNYHNLDFYLQCIFPIVIYFTLSKKWIFQFVAAMLFCFTKEPAIIIYGGFCVGVVLADICKCNENAWGMKIKRILSTKHYYSMALPGILWISTFLLLGPWSAGVGGAAVDFEYMIEKIKVLYMLNFNWLLVLVILIAGIKVLFTKGEKKGWEELVIPLVISQILFTIFSCCFKTVNHPRYADSNVVTLSFLAVLAICYLLYKNFAYVAMGAMIAVMLVSSYRTIDPISKKCFKTVNIGNTEMISTMTPFLGDGMIYNKQMLWLENVMNQAFADVLEGGSYVLLPALEDSTYFFDGMAEVANIKNEYQIDTYYWIRGKRNYFPQNGAVELNCVQISDDVEMGTIKDKIGQEYIDYLYFDNIDSENNKKFLTQYKVIERAEYQYRGWKLNRIRIQL